MFNQLSASAIVTAIGLRADLVQSTGAVEAKDIAYRIRRRADMAQGSGR